MRRREFISLLGGVAATWPLAVRAQQSVGSPSATEWVPFVTAFQRGLKETGYVEGENLTIEYRWAEGQYDRLPALAADLVRRQVAVIFAAGSAAPALAAKAATETIPIVFAHGADPVQFGMVASLNRPGGNVTGVNFLAAATPAARAAKAATATIPIVFTTTSDPVQIGFVASLNRPGGNMTGVTIRSVEVGAKLLELLHEAIPTAKIMALLVNPTNPQTDTLSRNMQAAARTFGLQLHVLNASTEREFDTVFATLGQLRADGLILGSDVLFTTWSGQLAALTARRAVPAVFQNREFAAAGGLMSY